ncbi:MAG: DUF4258 domain-containing protein [Acutalibacteraceae bacterium]
MTIELWQKLCNNGNIKWTLHALKRIRERNIKSSDVISCISNGQIIEHYPNDRPLPSCLIYGVVHFRHLHTVVSSDGSTDNHRHLRNPRCLIFAKK